MGVEGACAARFAGVRTAFAENFSDRGDVGAAVAVAVDGEVVVDLWGGHLDAARTRAWEADSLVNVWSTTKGIAALCFAMLVDRGKLSYDDAVAAHWPEFAAAGKEAVTVAQMLSHQAGLCGFREPAVTADFFDQAKASARLAAQEPFWPVGERCGYHAITIGILANELFRRVEGRTMGRFIVDELGGATGGDFTLGLPAGRENRAAEMIAPADMSSSDVAREMGAAQVAALANPALDPLAPNSAGWRAAELPSANGFGTARALARVFGALAVGGGNIVGSDALAEATSVRIAQTDLILGIPMRWAAGFARNVGGLYGPSDGAFGHSGWGGSFAFADPEKGIAIAYVMNGMGKQLAGDPRNEVLIAAVYGSR